MSDEFYEMMEPTYGEILQHINDIKKEVKYLDQDSLVDEVSAIQHHIIGKEADKIQYLHFKHSAEEDLDDEEMEFLRNIYLIYYCACAIVVDEPEEE